MARQGCEGAEEGATEEERAMEKFMILHCGFENPTPEIMEAWGRWFESIAHRQVDQGG